MVNLRSAIRFTALAAVTLVGAGAYAFDRPAVPAGAETPLTVSAAGSATGADGAPGSDQPWTGATDADTVTARSLDNPTGGIRMTLVGSTTRATSCPQGEYQRNVEYYLRKLGGFGTITFDGRQSAADCAAIKKFQLRYDIRPAEGRAGPTTFDVVKRLATTRTSDCSTGTGITFCVDLTRQTVWAMNGRTVVMKPTVTRTGMRGYRTPSGTYKVNFRNVKEWSDPYDVWLPYWQRFYRGDGFHQTTTYIHNKSIGSHGCVNLLPTDAKRMWELGRVGTRVHLFGRRPGT